MDYDGTNLVREIIREVRDKAAYLKDVSAEELATRPDYYEGMAMAYTFAIDGIIDLIDANDDIINREYLGIDDYEPLEVFEYLKR